MKYIACRKCEPGILGASPAIDIRHLDNGGHELIYPRPDHRTVSMWNDLRAALENVRMVEFYLGYLPEKPRGWDDDAVRMQLADARAVLGQLANALAGEAGS